MDFYQQFELLDLVKDDGVKTFEAKEIATGRPVRVHLFVSPKAPLQAALLKAVDRLPEEESRRILQRGKNEGTPYLVTDRLLDHKSLQDWVLAVTRAKPAEDAAPHPPASPANLNEAGAWKISHTLPVSATIAEDKPGNGGPDLLATVEIPVPTGLFAGSSQSLPVQNAAGQTTAGPDTTLKTPQTPQMPTAESQAEIQKDEPSEFTKMFQAPVPSAAGPSKSNEKPAGEFTRMFQSTPVAPPPRSAPAGTPVATPPRKAGEPGEFTRMFQSTSSAPANVPKPSSAQGEFTRMFQRVPEPARSPGVSTEASMPVTSATAPPPPAAATPATTPGEFTGFFQTPAEQPFASPLPQTLPMPPLAPQGEKAGEFTRMFGQTDMAALRDGLSAGLPGAPSSSSPGISSTSGATQAFASPPVVEQNVEPNVEPETPSTPPAGMGGSPQGAPGEYTRMFSAPTELTLGQGGASANSPSGQPQMPQVQMQAPQIQTPQVPQVPVVSLPTPSLPTPSMTAPSPPQVQIPQPDISMPSAPSSLPSMQAPGAPIANAPSGPASSKLPLILGLVGLVVVAIAVVIYFAMAKR